jgi:single-stranded DNA-binding protein
MQTMNQLFLLGHVGKNTEVHHFPDGGRKQQFLFAQIQAKAKIKFLNGIHAFFMVCQLI